MKLNSIWQPYQPKFHDQLDLNIRDTSLYHCNVYRYSQSHRELTIAVHTSTNNSEAVFYLIFESVWYFQGPLSWDGIDFELADAEELKSLIQKVFSNIEDNMLDSFSKQFALYMIYKPSINIQILAGNCFTLKSIST
jgi:hypothetical protein